MKLKNILECVNRVRIQVNQPQYDEIYILEIELKNGFIWHEVHFGLEITNNEDVTKVKILDCHLRGDEFGMFDKIKNATLTKEIV